MSTTTTTTQTSTSSHLPTTTSTAASKANDPTYIPSGPVTASLKFYAPPTDGSRPFNYVETPPEGQPTRNFSDTDISIPINDIRGHESDFTLDKAAFQAISMPASTSPRNLDYTSDETIKQEYYPLLEQTIKANVPGAHRIVFFDHTIRRAVPNAPRAPVTRAHIDQTPPSALARVHRHIPDPAEAEQLLKGRYRIINIWRPLNPPVQSFPLAFADSSSVRDEDLVGIEHRYPDRTGETAGVRYDEGQRWWYFSGMSEGEGLLLCCFDSERGGRVPHSAFVDPRTPVGARGRESIEVRALVFG